MIDHHHFRSYHDRLKNFTSSCQTINWTRGEQEREKEIVPVPGGLVPLSTPTAGLQPQDSTLGLGRRCSSGDY